MLAGFTSIDKVSIVALARKIEAEEGTTTTKALAGKLSVPLMSEHRNRKNLIDRLKNTGLSVAKESNVRQEALNKLIRTLMIRCGAAQNNEMRASYAPWFKDLITELHKEGTSFAELQSLTNVSIDTLVKFKSSDSSKVPDKEPIDKLSSRIASIWTEAPPYYRDNLDAFWEYLGKKHGDLSVSKSRVREVLINLGLRYPRGPQTRNIGTQVKKEFVPHAIWEGDGKQLKITINGQDHIYSWYAFVDQNTTLIVGSNIAPTESSANFLTALKNGQYKSGSYPIGILIDNRLGDTDMGAIDSFCKEHRIVLIRTFPGNSKSNGNIENNFSLFESLVGPIILNGTESDVAAQVATMVVEIFTGLRNNTRRPRLHNQTPLDASKDKKRPEDTRTAIEKMAKRLNKEVIDAEAKWQLIETARSHFGVLSEASENKIKRQLKNYLVLDIIAAQAAYIAQINKYPTNTYASEYFMAILRHKRESIAKSCYNEIYRAGIAYAIDLENSSSPGSDLPQIIMGEMVKIPNLPTPSEQMLHLEAISWWLVAYGAKKSNEVLTSLWRQLGDLSETTPTLSLRWWQKISEYISEKIGFLLYDDLETDPPEQPSVIPGQSEMQLGH